MKIALALLISLLALGAAADPVIHAACTDYATGMLSSMDAFAPWTAHPDLLSIHSDAVLRWGGDHLDVIGRLGADNLWVLDPETLGTVSQFSTGRPATRRNSRSLFVTSVASEDSAWAAMSVSRGPMGVPLSSRAARTWP